MVELRVNFGFDGLFKRDTSLELGAKWGYTGGGDSGGSLC